MWDLSDQSQIYRACVYVTLTHFTKARSYTGSRHFPLGGQAAPFLQLTVVYYQSKPINGANKTCVQCRAQATTLPN